MHSKRVAVPALTAAVAAPFAQTRTGETETSREAQAQSRADSIHSARTQKQANLTPWAKPITECVIQEGQNRLPYRFLTGEAHRRGV